MTMIKGNYPTRLSRLRADSPPRLGEAKLRSDAGEGLGVGVTLGNQWSLKSSQRGPLFDQKRLASPSSSPHPQPLPVEGEGGRRTLRIRGSGQRCECNHAR